MRFVQHPQRQIGEIDIAKIEFDLKSRDDIPRILRGLQHVYMDVPLRTQIFALLEAEIAPKVSKRNGRPGMELWKIFVCGVVRLDLNEDYDRLHELVNKHIDMRQMLGHGAFADVYYHQQTLIDNVSLFTPELLDKVNQLIVDSGHILLKKKGSEALRGRCDSFVVETKVHYPTDINLLYDALRKVITLIAQWCDRQDVSDWRQSAYNVRHVKRLMRMAQNRKRSRATSESQRAKNAQRMVQAHQEYLAVAERYLNQAGHTLAMFAQRGFSGELDVLAKIQIEGFMQHATRQMDQIRRRVMLGEVIPHGEKVFSLFEPHTEWISKGKAGVPVELGVKVCILEDQHQFILHHQVMQKQTDDQVAVSMVKEAQERFPRLQACSFDKGFHSPQNQIALSDHLVQLTLPRKGKLSQPAQEAEQSDAFVKARRAHSAVESAINALEVHGLDRCLDHGIDGFKRYVAWAIVARNIHRIGAILWQREQKRDRRSRQYIDPGPLYQRAA